MIPTSLFGPKFDVYARPQTGTKGQGQTILNEKGEKIIPFVILAFRILTSLEPVCSKKW